MLLMLLLELFLLPHFSAESRWHVFVLCRAARRSSAVFSRRAIDCLTTRSVVGSSPRVGFQIVVSSWLITISLVVRRVGLSLLSGLFVDAILNTRLALQSTCARIGLAAERAKLSSRQCRLTEGAVRALHGRHLKEARREHASGRERKKNKKKRKAAHSSLYSS